MSTCGSPATRTRCVASATLLCVALFASACAPKRRPGIPPRNLVLVTVAGLRADRLGAYLHDRPTSSLPVDETARAEGRAMGLDDLAAAGVVFAHCQSPSPLVMPSLASLMTSRTPLESGVTSDDDGVPDDVATLAELFSAAGFRTGAFVTAGALDLEGAFGRGFALFRASADDATTLAAASDWARADQGDGSRRFVWIHLRGPDAVWSGATRSSAPDVPDLPDAAQLPEVTESPDVAALMKQRDFGPGLRPSEIAALRAGDAPPDARKRTLLSNEYDRAVARTMLALAVALREAFDYYESNADASETWARTVFAFTSPCGSLLGEDGAVAHSGTLHEAVLRVPLILRHPDSLTGERVIGDVVELTDLLPTFVEWFDLPSPERVQGRSLLQRLDGARRAPFTPRPSITALPERVFSARAERFHLVWNPLGGKPADRARSAAPIAPLALYEPDRDPFERDDVSALHPDVVLRLQDAVKEWRDAQHVHPPQTRRALHEGRARETSVLAPDARREERSGPKPR